MSSHLSDTQASNLIADFSPEDVFKTLKCMAKNKSSGPDGYSPEFCLAAWSVVGTEITSDVLYFFETLHLPRIINSVAITLVPWAFDTINWNFLFAAFHQMVFLVSS